MDDNIAQTPGQLSASTAMGDRQASTGRGGEHPLAVLKEAIGKMRPGGPEGVRAAPVEDLGARSRLQDAVAMLAVRGG